MRTFNQSRLRQPIDVSAEKQQTGNWEVLFAPGYFVTVDGQALGYSPYMSHECIKVSPDGRPAVLRRPWSPKDDGGTAMGQTEPPTPSAVEVNGITESTAILIARSCAIRKGLIPTDTAVEEQQLDNGEWLVSIVPGVYLTTPPGATPSPALAPFVVHVDKAGQCRFMPEPGQPQ
jgi:hypothetical protein